MLRSALAVVFSVMALGLVSQSASADSFSRRYQRIANFDINSFSCDDWGSCRWSETFLRDRPSYALTFEGYSSHIYGTLRIICGSRGGSSLIRINNHMGFGSAPIMFANNCPNYDIREVRLEVELGGADLGYPSQFVLYGERVR